MKDALNPARARLISLALLVIGAGIVWFNPGDQLRGGARALSLVVLAGVGALVAARGGLRRLASIVVLVCAAGLMVGGTTMAVIGGILPPQAPGRNVFAIASANAVSGEKSRTSKPLAPISRKARRTKSLTSPRSAARGFSI